MRARTAKRRGSLWPAALALVAAALLAGAALAGGGAPAPEPAQAQQVRIVPPDSTPQTGLKPVRLRIAAVGIDTTLVPLGLLANGDMEVPADASVAGWYDLGPRPGQPGPAVIAGHVDSRQGPGVFFPLRQVRPGDLVEVTLEDGSVLRFPVTAVEQHPKDALPVERIWNDTEEPVLRLVTCGGTFDRQSRHYTDNIVVFAARPAA